MVLLSTPLPDFRFKISDFKLISTDGLFVSLNEIKGKNGTLIMFICNHCPYVKAVISEVVKITPQIKRMGFGVVAIMPNDTISYKEDNFDNMKIFSKQNSFNFPYLLDDDQSVAKKYHAICTPDFFCFNNSDFLQYRGRILEMKNLIALNPKKNELLDAIKMIATTGYGPKTQFPSIGCSIKWKQC